MNPTKTGVLTSEFWVKLAALAGSVVTFVFVMRSINYNDPNAPNAIINALSPVIIGVGTIWGLIYGASKYGTNRTALKVAAIHAASPRSPRIIDDRGK